MGQTVQAPTRYLRCTEELLFQFLGWGFRSLEFGTKDAVW